MPTIIEAPARRIPLAGYVYAGAVVLIWVSFNLSGRYAALGGGVRLTPWDLGALRYVVAGIAAAALWLAGVGRGLSWGRGLATGVIAGLGFPLPAYLGFTYAPVAHGAVILSGLLPMLVAAGSYVLFKERWSRMRMASLAVLLAGVLLLGFEAYVQGARPGAWRGDLLFLVSSIAWAIYTLLARLWGATPMQAVVAVGLWCAALYLPVWWIALPSTLTTAPVGEVLFHSVFQGLFAVVLSLFLFTRAIALLGPARLTTVTALVPGLAGLIAVPLLGEHMGPPAVAGLVLVCLAVALGVIRTR